MTDGPPAKTVDELTALLPALHRLVVAARKVVRHSAYPLHASGCGAVFLANALCPCARDLFEAVRALDEEAPS